MAIGLSEKELEGLLCRGHTEQEIAGILSSSIYINAAPNELLAKVVFDLGQRVLRAVVENNERINEQLVSAGIRVSD